MSRFDNAPVQHVVAPPKYHKVHAHGPCKSPRSKGANKSSYRRHQRDAYDTYASKRTAVNVQVERHLSKEGVYSVDTCPPDRTERDWNQELKRIHGKAWQKAKAGHPQYRL